MCGTAVAWKAGKQATVTTSSTEAELLAITETAKEAMFLARILRALDALFEQPPIIQCDNTSTIRLLIEPTATLTTRLRHVDIHTHWLRQDVQLGHIKVEYVSTASNIADGFTKALPRQKFEQFRSAIGLVNRKGQWHSPTIAPTDLQPVGTGVSPPLASADDPALLMMDTTEAFDDFVIVDTTEAAPLTQPPIPAQNLESEGIDDSPPPAVEPFDPTQFLDDLVIVNQDAGLVAESTTIPMRSRL
jgi:hypothetical protein